MPISAQWLDDTEEVLLVTYTHPWSWEEFGVQTTQISEMARSAEQPVAIITDLTAVGSPPDYNVLSHLRKVAFPENVVLNIVINAPTFLRSLITIAVNTIARQMGDKTFMVSSLEEAQQVVAAQKAKIPK